MAPNYLTQEEVSELPDDTEVIITWSGGNGPYHYVIEQNRGETFAQILSDPKGTLRWYFPIRFVGKEKFHTRVHIPREALNDGIDASPRGSS